MASNKVNSGVINFTISHPNEICVCTAKHMYQNVSRIIICNSKQLETTLSMVSTLE